MKGVILAGGYGKRLFPLTKVTNKHLLPVYDRPMIFFPIQTLVSCGITEMLIVTGTECVGDFMSLLGSGKEFKASFTYRVQDGAGGIAEALSLAEDFAGGEKFAVILGDNVFTESFAAHARDFESSQLEAMVFLKEVEKPERFGVATVQGGRIISIIEKPAQPESNLAVAGFYLYDGKSVFDIVRSLEPSGRNELEITDVNSEYLRRGKLGFRLLAGEWTDAGTFESLHAASGMARKAGLGK
ncbi:MAG: sugar phosphate nucleotidyltransferase [Candidatus Micrarchaeia archaeon]